MKKDFTSVKEHATNVTNLENRKILPLMLKLHQETTACFICGKRFLKKFVKNKGYWKARDHCHFTVKYRGAAHSLCNLRFNVSNEVPVVFHIGSNHDCNFIIK